VERKYGIKNVINLQNNLLPQMDRINIKPLSVNKAWMGKKFKTADYHSFEKECLYRLPKLPMPKPPFEVTYKFGFSNRNSDLLNPEKLVTDILCKKYNIDDRYIEKMTLTKEIVPKGQEYFEFSITHYATL